MGGVLLNLAPFFGLIGVGLALGRFGGLDRAGVRGLNSVIYWVGMPALLFGVLSKADPASALDLRLAAAYGLGLLLAGLSAALGARVLARASAEDAAGAGMAGCVGNTAFLGYPLALATFGEAAIAPAAAALLIDNALVLPLLVAGVVGARGGGGLFHGLWVGFVGAARNPTVLAALAGLIAAVVHASPPPAFARAIEMAAGASTPVALLALGAMIGLWSRGRASDEPALSGRDGTAIGSAVLAKVALAPLFVAGLAALTGAPADSARVLVLLAAAPTALGVFVQTGVYGVFHRQATLVVIATTLLSVAGLALAASA